MLLPAGKELGSEVQKDGSCLGLEDRRGRRAGSQTARTPEEKDRDEKAAMRKRIHDLELENAYLKKVRELAMKHRYR